MSDITPKPIDVLTKDQAAELLGIGESLFDKVRRRYQIPSVPWCKTRFFRGTLEMFLQGALDAQAKLDHTPRPSIKQPLKIGRV